MIVDYQMDPVMGCTIYLVLVLLTYRLAEFARTICKGFAPVKMRSERRTRSRKGWPLIGRFTSGFI